MERELYEVMDWAAVEEIVYSESADPHAILGPHKTDKTQPYSVITSTTPSGTA